MDKIGKDVYSFIYSCMSDTDKGKAIGNGCIHFSVWMSAEPLSAVLRNELTGPLLTSVSVADTDSRTSHVASSFIEKTTRTIRHFVLDRENQTI